MSEAATERTANTVTVDIDQDLYAKYEHVAMKYKIPVSRLINQELRRVEARRQAQEKLRRLRKSPFDLRNRKPVSLGKILKPWNSRAELLEDFFDRGDDDDRP